MIFASKKEEERRKPGAHSAPTTEARQCCGGRSRGRAARTPPAHHRRRPRAVGNIHGTGRGVDPRGILLDGENGIRHLVALYHDTVAAPADHARAALHTGHSHGAQDRLEGLLPPHAGTLLAVRGADGRDILHRYVDQRRRPLDRYRLDTVPAVGGVEGNDHSDARAPHVDTPGQHQQDTSAAHEFPYYRAAADAHHTREYMASGRTRPALVRRGRDGTHLVGRADLHRIAHNALHRARAHTRAYEAHGRGMRAGDTAYERAAHRPCRRGRRTSVDMGQGVDHIGGAAQQLLDVRYAACHDRHTRGRAVRRGAPATAPHAHL